MHKAELEKLVNGDPKKFIDAAEEMSVDLSALDKNIHTTIVKERYGLTQDQIEAVDFVFWIAYFVEHEAASLIIEPEVHAGANRNIIESAINKLHFTDKIKMIEENYTGKKDPLIRLMYKIKDFRNDIAHGRFSKLEYGGYHLSDNRARLLIIGNLRDAFRKKNH